MLMRKQNAGRGPARWIRNRRTTRRCSSTAESAWMQAEGIEPVVPDPIQIAGPNLMMIATERQNDAR